MRKRFVVFGIIAAVTAVISARAYLRHCNTDSVKRARMIAADLQGLRVATSDFTAAQLIAEKYGTVPYENHYGTQDCTAGYFERCAYMLRLNDGRLRRLVAKHPSLGRLGIPDWTGTALIYIQNGTVTEYSFGIVYTSKEGMWRGIGAEELLRCLNTEPFKQSCPIPIPSNGTTSEWAINQAIWDSSWSHPSPLRLRRLNGVVPGISILVVLLNRTGAVKFAT